VRAISCRKYLRPPSADARLEVVAELVVVAELHEVAVVADLVVAALEVAELHEVARQAGADAPLEVVAARAELLDVGRVAQEHDTRR